MANKKNKSPLGKSFKKIFFDTNELPLINHYLGKSPEISNTDNEKGQIIAEKECLDKDKDVFNDPHIDEVDIHETNFLEENFSDNIYSFDLKKIGTILKFEREKKGLTINEISDIMKVRRYIIDAIENGIWERLPHEIYVKGYIKEYAGILKIRDAILPYFNIPNRKKPEIDIAEEDKKSLNKRVKFTVKRNRFLSRATFIYSLIVLFMITGFIIFNFKQEKVDNSRLEKAIQFSNNIEGIKQEKHATVLTTNKKLFITCHERTWLSIIMDGNEKKEFMLNPGEVMILNAKERFDILVGNAGGIKFILNGKDVDFSGISGQVKKITL